MGKLHCYGNVTVVSKDFLGDNELDDYCNGGRLIGFTFNGDCYVYVFNYD